MPLLSELTSFFFSFPRRWTLLCHISKNPLHKLISLIFVAVGYCVLPIHPEYLQIPTVCILNCFSPLSAFFQSVYCNFSLCFHFLTPAFLFHPINAGVNAAEYKTNQIFLTIIPRTAYITYKRTYLRLSNESICFFTTHSYSDTGRSD